MLGILRRKFKNSVAVMQSDIKNFLRYGYYLDYPADFEVCPNSVRPNYACSPFDFLKKGISKWLDSDQRDVIVPLSGGVDSRLLVAILLEMKSASSI